VPSYALAGVAAAGAASFAFFSLSGRSQLRDLEDCKPYCARDDVQSVRTKYLIADISLGVSLVALGSAAYLWLRPAPVEQARAGGISWDVAATPHGAALGVRWKN
jgi:hypothetical protein